MLSGYRNAYYGRDPLEVEASAPKIAGVSRRENARNIMRWVLVSDPIPVEEGGFRPGVTFCKEDIDRCLIFESFQVGTILENREIGGRVVRYRVIMASRPWAGRKLSLARVAA